MRVTIRDVSEAAAVSVATVSNVLNAPERVALETRERVLGVVRRLGYQPNRTAQALKRRRTCSIGYRIPESVAAYGFALDVFLHQMTERAGQAGLGIVLFTPTAGETEARAYRGMIRGGAVDGFVLSETGHGDERVRYLLDAGLPFVTFGRTDVADQHSWVDTDGRAGVRAAVEHLVELGHRRIGLIAWPEGSLSGDDRAAGYFEGLGAFDLPADDQLIVRCENHVEAGRLAMNGLLGLPRPPSAVIAVQDLLALGASAAVAEARLSVGTDVAVVGFDDTPMAAFATPPLSSVRQPMEEIGRLVIELLLAQFDETTEAGAHCALVEPRLIVRASSLGKDPRE